MKKMLLVALLFLWTTISASAQSTTTPGEAIITNRQAGTTYTVKSSDRKRVVIFTNAGTKAVTLPIFSSGWYGWFYNTGAGAATITPSSGTIGGSATLVLAAGKSAKVVRDSTGYVVPQLDLSTAERAAVAAASTGDVVGPGSATDNAVARFDSTTGKVIQNSAATIDDSGSVNIPTGQTYKINSVALAKGDVGLGNVDNTSDAGKPVSTAQQTALDLKQATLTLGTGVNTALGVNVGSAGAFVVNGGALGTPSSGVATNLTGTAAGLTAGSVTANANLTGPITSVGNATSIASQTGTGTKFVVDTSPTLVTPVLGVASATSLAIPTLTGVSTITGTAGNMTITAGTGNSRTMALQSTTSGGVATTFLTGNADQSVNFAGDVNLANGAGLTAASLATLNTAGLRIKSGAYFGISSASDNSTASDVTISRNAAGIIQIGTTAANPLGTIMAAVGTIGTSATIPRLGIGTSAADANNLINGTMSSTSAYVLSANNSDSSGIGRLRVRNDASKDFEAGVWGSARTTYGAIVASDAYVYSITNLDLTADSASGVIKFATGSSVPERGRFDSVGNFKLAGTAVRGTTEGTNHTDIFDGTAPVGTLANGVSLYSTAGELRVMDSGGTATLLSSHSRVTGNWIHDSYSAIQKKRLIVQTEEMSKFIDAKFGTHFVQEIFDDPERNETREASVPASPDRIGGTQSLTPTPGATVTLTIDVTAKHVVASWTSGEAETINVSGTPQDGTILTLIITNDGVLGRLITPGTGLSALTTVLNVVSKKSTVSFVALGGVFYETSRTIGI